MPLSSDFLGGITSPLGSLIGASPPSALNEVREHALLYAETGDEAHLRQIRHVVQYAKTYRKATAGMDRKERRRAVSNAKWAIDIPAVALYEFVYSDQAITLEDVEQIRREIEVTWADITPTRYPDITPEHLQTLKYSHLLTGKYLDISWARVFIVLGTFHLANRAENPRYRPLSSVKARVDKTPEKPLPATPAVVSVRIGCALPPAIEKARALEKVKAPAHFGGPTAMQLAILEEAYAQNHSITQSEEFESCSLLFQCYMAQSAGIKAPSIDVPSYNGESSRSASAEALGPMSTLEKQLQEEDAILTRLGNDVLKHASISSYELTTNISDKVVDALEAGVNKLEMGIDKGKETFRRVLSIKNKKKIGLTRVQEMRKAEGFVPRIGPMGASTTTLLSNGGDDESVVCESEAEQGFGAGDEGDDDDEDVYAVRRTPFGREPGAKKQQQSVHPLDFGPPSSYGEKRHTDNAQLEGPLLDPTSSILPSPNMNLDSIVESTISPDAVGSVVDENHRSSDDGWVFMKKARESVSSLVSQNDKNRMREQRREHRERFEMKD